MSTYVKMISPHYDSVEVARDGWRADPKDILVSAGSELKGKAQGGFLAALYTLRANASAPAFLREPGVAYFQRCVADAIRAIEEGEL